ncbi:MAG: M14 family metallopeptidase [Chloracidobacterium sp.]|nr:M14 family metallopeptidase [Chloracidobacterium sp.]
MQSPTEPRSRAEKSGFEETSRYAEVIEFFTQLEKNSPLIRSETFGKTNEGRDLPLYVFSDPPVSTPREAGLLKKPIIFVMANIHGGEVEGKEAAQHLARRLLFGDLKALTKKLTILIAPIYNADGNEKISMENRVAQYGPIGGVGVRENAQRLDLNRDYIKLDSPEARGLVGLFNRWDPHLTVDLHTTNGSYHAYHLTYSHPLNPNTDQRILDFQRNTMMPAIASQILKKHNFRTYYYGNFRNFANRLTPGEKPVWEAFTHQPRIGQNYGGLRNRLTILSEAYSYLSFKRRVEVTERFVEEILNFSAANAAQILRLLKAADADTVRKLSSNKPVQFGVKFKIAALPKPVNILVGDVEKVKNPRSGKEMTAMIEDKVTPTLMEELGMFQATQSVRVPFAYLLKSDKAVVEKLQQHGIAVEEMTSEVMTEVESFQIDKVEKASRAFQGHSVVSITGSFKTETVKFPPGTVIVRTAQPLGRLVFYLLEPESDDGLTTWNFFDPSLEAGRVFPVYKLHKNRTIAGRILSN